MFRFFLVDVLIKKNWECYYDGMRNKSHNETCILVDLFYNDYISFTSVNDSLIFTVVKFSRNQFFIVKITEL